MYYAFLRALDEKRADDIVPTAEPTINSAETIVALNAIVAQAPVTATRDEATAALKRFIDVKGSPAAAELVKSLGGTRVSELTDEQRGALVAQIAIEVPA